MKMQFQHKKNCYVVAEPKELPLDGTDSLVDIRFSTDT
jgi:hypothetical protein